MLVGNGLAACKGGACRASSLTHVLPLSAAKGSEMANNNASSSGGIGFFGLLFIVFLVLKLTHVIDWSWWWITAPLWGGAVIFLVVFIVALSVFLALERGKASRR